VHLVATVGYAFKIGKFPFDRHRRSGETHVYRSAARANILAQPTPTHPRRNRCSRHCVTNRTT
jgi:hypothetical protein